MNYQIRKEVLLASGSMRGQEDIGRAIHDLAWRLWPINRSLTGEGVRETLRILGEITGDMEIHEVPSGTEVFDWTVPKEWRVREAYLLTPDGTRICDFHVNNLHLLGYSTGFKGFVDFEELKSHLYSLPDQPTAIPYITSYYSPRWGFCLSHDQYRQLQPGRYYVHIDAEHFDGSLSYGEVVIPGESEEEIFFSTYVCHPSMANNELSGPCVSAFLARYIRSLGTPRYTYRFAFVPETIGSICYVNRNLDHLRRHVHAGFNVTCVGDNRSYSYLPSRKGNTISDVIARHVLKNTDPDFAVYSWNDRGSDERQYCAPGVDLPIASMMRTKYAEYPEYHTSLDDLVSVVTPEGLGGGYAMLTRAIEVLEYNATPHPLVLCEPQLGKRGLYPTLSTKDTAAKVRLMMNVLTWSDGEHTILDIAEKCDAAFWEVLPIISLMQEEGVLKLV